MSTGRTPLSWANRSLWCIHMSMYFRCPFSLQRKLLPQIWLNTEYVLIDCFMQDHWKKTFKIDTGNQQAFLGTVSVRMLIYMAVFLFPRKLTVWFKRCCSLERGKMTFRITLFVCRFTQTAELLPPPHFGFRNLTMQWGTRNSQDRGQLSAFATDLWYLI